MKPIRFETLAWLFLSIFLSSFLFLHFFNGIYLTSFSLTSYLSFYYPKASLSLPFHEPISKLFLWVISLCSLSCFHLWGVIGAWLILLFLWILLFHYLFSKLRFVILATFLLFFFSFLFHLTFDATFFSLFKALLSLSLLFFFFLSVETRKEKYVAYGFLLLFLLSGEVVLFLLPYSFFLAFFSPIGKERLFRFAKILLPYLVVLFIFFWGFHWHFYFPPFSFLSLSWSSFFLYLFIFILIGTNWIFFQELNLEKRIRTGAILSLLLFSFLFHIFFSQHPFFIVLLFGTVSLATVHLLSIVKERRRKSLLWLPYGIILIWGIVFFLYEFQPYFRLQKANAYRYKAFCHSLFTEKEYSVLTDNLLFHYQCPRKAVLFLHPITSSEELYFSLCTWKPHYLFVQEEFLSYLKELWVSYQVLNRLSLPMQRKKLLLIRLNRELLSCPS